MADPHWTSYVGMGTGIVGAITGVAGAIMGYVSYRKSNNLKTLDLRIELPKQINHTKTIHEKLLSLMRDADGSRKAILAALGVFRSSTMDKWSTTYEADTKSLRQQAKKIPDRNATYDNLSQKDLESKIVDIYQIQSSLNNLLDKYSDALAWDDEQRKQLREDQRVHSTLMAQRENKGN